MLLTIAIHLQLIWHMIAAVYCCAECGEAFRPLIPGWIVTFSYAIAIAYVRYADHVTNHTYLGSSYIFEQSYSRLLSKRCMLVQTT
jgi:hypothetical protein